MATTTAPSIIPNVDRDFTLSRIKNLGQRSIQKNPIVPICQVDLFFIFIIVSYLSTKIREIYLLIVILLQNEMYERIYFYQFWAFIKSDIVCKLSGDKKKPE